MAQQFRKYGCLVAILMAASTTQAEDKPKETVKSPPKAQPPQPDADFLEFLANWDSEDEEWAEFLAANVEKEKQAQEEDRKKAAKQAVKKVDEHE